MMRMLKKFVKDERGLEASEYALLLALIAIAIVVTVTALKTAIAGKFQLAADTISAPPVP